MLNSATTCTIQRKMFAYFMQILQLYWELFTQVIQGGRLPFSRTLKEEWLLILRNGLDFVNKAISNQDEGY